MSAVPPRAPERWRPALPPQVTLWLLHQLDARLPDHFVPLALRYKGLLPPHLLQQALGEISRRHGVLRWQFRTTRGALEYVEHRWTPPILPIAEVSLPGPDEARLRAIARSVIARPFAIDDYPLFRVLHVRLGPRAGLVLGVFHHALADGWSTAVLGAELSALWTRFGAGLTSTLPELRVQYADLWTPDRTRAADEHLRYWKETLGDLEGPSAWPWPHWRSRGRDDRVRRHADRLDQATSAAIVRAAGQMRASAFVFFAAVLSLLRWRLSGQTSTVIGTDTAGRTEPAAEALIGFFINLLPLRLDLDPRASFRDHLADTRRRFLAAYEHQGVPYEEIVRAVDAPRSAGRNPLFSLKLMMHNFRDQLMRLPGVTLASYPVTLSGSGEDVKLFIRHVDGAYACDWEARGESLSQAELEAVAHLFTQTIDHVLAAPDIALLQSWPSSLASAPPAESTEPSPAGAGARAGAAGLDVAAVAARTPGHLLVRAAGRDWTADAFCQQVARLGAGLRTRGAGPGVLIALALKPSIDALLCACAALTEGAGFVSLDPREPADVTEITMRAAAPALVVIDGDAVASPALATAARTVRLGDLANGVPPAEPAGTQVPADDDLAFVAINRQGSDARDAVASRFARAALARQFDSWSAAWRDVPGDVVVHPDPRDTLALLADLRVCLDQQRTLMVGGEGDSLSTIATPPAACCYVRLHGTAGPASVPVSLPDWLTAGNRRAHVVVAGRVTPAFGLSLTRAHPNVRLYVVTQLPGVALAAGLGEWREAWQDLCRVPVACAWGDVTLHLLDAWRQPAPVSGVGEIHISSEDLPLRATGIRGVRLADSHLMIIGDARCPAVALGRCGDAARTECLLLQHPAVADAIVVQAKDGGTAGAVTALVTAAGSDLRVEELWTMLAGRLARDAMPDALRIVPALPLDWHGQPIPWQPAPAVSDPATRAIDIDRASLRAALAQIWREVLGLDREIGAHEDFFHLGGDSILATQLAFRLEERGAELSVGDVFAHRTLAGLAERLAASTGAAAVSVRLEGVDRRGLLPMASAQDRLFFLHRLNPLAVAYHCPVALELRGRPNLALLVQAFQEIVRRQEALRTVFLTQEGELRQRVLPHVATTPVWVDLTAIASPYRSALANRIRRADLRRPFQLETAPAVRVIAADLGDAGPGDRVWHLSLTMHHLISDAWSERVLIRELNALVARYATGRASDLASLPFQYGDYTVWQAKRLQGSHLTGLMDGWSELAGDADFEPIRLDATAAASARTAGRVGYRRFTIASALRGTLEAAGRSRGATLYIVALAAFQCLLHRLTGQPRVTFIASAANRYPAEMAEVIGFFANTFPCASTWTASDTVLTLLERTRAYLADALRLQELPFDRIVEAIRRRRPGVDPSRLNISFVMTPASAGGGLVVPETTVRSIVMDDVHAKFDLELQLNGGPDGIAGTLEYDTSFLTDATADALVTQYLAILDGIAHPAAVRTASRPTSGLRRPVPLSARPRPAPPAVVNGTRVPSSDSLPVSITLEPGAVRTWDACCHTHREEWTGLLKQRGAILFRNTAVSDVEEFRRFCQQLTPDLISYTERSSPRRDLGEQVYTSTEYPADETIFFHNECSYSRRFPRTLFFYCDRPAATGGETILCDSRKVYQHLSDALKRRFEQGGVTYARHYSGYLDLPWQTAFQTQDTAEVERYCQAAGIEWHWTSAGGLKTRQVSQAVLRHPETGEQVWFNQAHMFHLSALKDEYRSALLAMLDEADVPRHAYLGDGAAIGADDLAEIRAVYASLTCAVGLQRGDILWIDNILCAHGRKAFTGDRRVAVIMSEPMQASE